MFIGRKDEIDYLKDIYQKNESALVCMYGRRRVGKSELLKHFGKNTNCIYIEGLEHGTTPDQIKSFLDQLRLQVSNDTNLYRLDFSDWDKVFIYLTNFFSQKHKKKIFIVFDEFQWMAAGQSKIVSLLKMHWDNMWKNQNIMLVLCGSVASFMVNKVIKSRALYGRIDHQIHVQPLSFKEAIAFFNKASCKSHDEIFNYLSLLGTIPKYLTLIDQSESFEKNIVNLFFKKDSYFIEEIEKIFFGHFKESQNYKKIVLAIASQGILNAEEISKVLKMKSGGGVKTYIDNLVLANFLSPVRNLATKGNSSTNSVKYRISDPYLKFYFSMIAPHVAGIKSGKGLAIFNQSIKKQLSSYLGLAFESLIQIHENEIIKALGINNEVVDSGRYLIQGNVQQKGVQVDLAFKMFDGTLALVEVKHSKTTTLSTLDKELGNKKQLVFNVENKSVLAYVVSVHKLTNTRSKKSKHINKIICINDLLK